MNNARTGRPKLDAVLLRRRFQEVENLLVRRYRLWEICVCSFLALLMFVLALQRPSKCCFPNSQTTLHTTPVVSKPPLPNLPPFFQQHPGE